MNNELKMGTLEWLMLVALAALWGGSFFFAKIALADIPPLTLVWLRVTIAATTLALVMRFTGRAIPRDPALWKTFMLMGLVNNLIPFSLLFWGQTHIGAGLASIFNATVPLFTVIIAQFTLADERLNAGKLIGVGLGIAGVAVMIGMDLSQGVGTWNVLAMLACIAASLSYGIASVYGRRFSAQGIAPISVAFGQLASTTVMLLPLALITEQPWTLAAPSTNTVLSVLALALACTALAYILFFRILARGGATNISLVTLLIPVSAVLLSTVFLDERLGLNHMAGMALILIGLLALDGRLLNALRGKRPLNSA
ncbi:MAG: DMT family transporter [Gammaproteobacteria bacterium]